MTDLWKELRAANIGGSEVAALFGECPYTTYFKLWHTKRSGLAEDDLSNNEIIVAGNFYESAIIQHANWKWDFDFFQPQVYVQHYAVEGMGCTPDAYSKNDPDLMAQIKRVQFHRFTIENGWQVDGETIIKAPLHIMLQVQHEMEVCQKKRSVLIVQVGGERLYAMLCDHNADTAAILRREVAHFWLRPLPPDPDFKKDGASIKRIKQSLPVSEFDDLSSDDDLHDLLLKAKKLDVDTKRSLDELDALKAEIYYFSKNHKAIKCKDIFVSFYDKKGGNRFRINMEGMPI